jgi:hypothetical protein
VGTSDLTTLLSACVCLSLKAKKLYKPKLLRKIVHKCYMQVREIQLCDVTWCDAM